MHAKELLELLARALVDDPDQVEVTEVEEPDELVLELRCAPDDVGKIIGRQGRTVRALRTLIDAAGEKHDRHYAVEVIE